MSTPGITSLREHIANLAKTTPQKNALLSCDEKGTILETITYQELSERINAAALYLHGLGLEKGDKVALAFKNSAELLVVSLAAWSAGIVTVPLDTKRDTIEQYQYKIELNKAKLLLVQPDILAALDTKQLQSVRIEAFSKLPTAAGSISWMPSLAHLALILFTSGTTGHPKGAQLSLENLIVNADGIREWLQFTADDTFLVNLPLHHINSTTFCLSTLLSGGTIAIVPTYSNSHFWQQVAATGATVTSIVQSILFDQLRREKEFEAVKKQVKLNRIQIGSAPVLPQSVQEFGKKFEIPLYQGYGQTETALRVTGVPMNLPKKLYDQLVEENSIGASMQWANVQIADETGKFLGENEEGELVVKGAANMSGYVAGEPAFRGDYFLSGDIGYFKIIDGKKYFYLKGRKREIIIKGGINISPSAVENSLKKISDEIEQVYVVAVADERYGEEIGAVICWKEGTLRPGSGQVDEVRAKRRLKLALLFGTPHLSAYETPKYITSLTLEELPMTSTGKVQRSVLKTTLPYEKFESIFGLLKTPTQRFTVLHRFSRWAQPSYDLYKQCWGELSPERIEYEKDIPKHLVVLAADAKDNLLGQIAIVRTGLSADKLLKTKYDQLLTQDVLNAEGNALVCISICSADYKQKPIPVVSRTPSIDEVEKYLPNDPVMRFHQKPKGGQSSGAELVGLIPQGRPEDKSSLGYNMLLKYPAPSGITITHDAPISNQLIEMALLVAQDLGVQNVYAVSRPGGLATYIAESH